MRESLGRLFLGAPKQPTSPAPLLPPVPPVPPVSGYVGPQWIPTYGDPASPFARLWWVLDPDDPYPCADCQRRAATGPYGRPGSGNNELDATPGDGQTRCGAACSCDLSYTPPSRLWTPHPATSARLPFVHTELYASDADGAYANDDDAWITVLIHLLDWVRPTRAELRRLLHEMEIEPRSDRWRLAMARVPLRE